jgi:two-component system chemotaxis response regulator CheB
MSRPIRLLVVDDAVIVRRMIALTLSEDPAFEVVGTPSDGELALAALEKGPVDLMVLDLDMPGMDGRTTLKQVRERWPQTQVVVFSGSTQPSGADLELLSLGASDCIPKLPHAGNMRGAIEWINGRLAPRLKELARQAEPTPAPSLPIRPAEPIVIRPVKRGSRPEVLVVGASTGGPNALEEFLAALPSDFPLPIIIVQHMPEGFTRLLGERLSLHTPFTAAEAVPGVNPVPGQAWIAQGGRHLVLRRVGPVLELQNSMDPPEHSCRPAVDVLFRSAAQVCGGATLAVVLTGMGYDGLAGAQAIVQAGGTVMVQDEESSVVWGMPGAIARAGIASQILTPAQLAVEVARRARLAAVAPAVPS